MTICSARGGSRTLAAWAHATFPSQRQFRRGLAITLLVLAAPAHAQFLTGAQLLEHLDQADAGTSFAKRTIALGYVSAVYDLAQGERVCPQSPIAASELTKVVHLFLRAHPERRSEPGAKLALDALAQRFPCAR
jgi:hypothetical protein